MSESNESSQELVPDVEQLRRDCRTRRVCKLAMRLHRIRSRSGGERDGAHSGVLHLHGAETPFATQSVVSDGPLGNGEGHATASGGLLQEGFRLYRARSIAPAAGRSGENEDSGELREHPLPGEESGCRVVLERAPEGELSAHVQIPRPDEAVSSDSNDTAGTLNERVVSRESGDGEKHSRKTSSSWSLYKTNRNEVVAELLRGGSDSNRRPGEGDDVCSREPEELGGSLPLSGGEQGGAHGAHSTKKVCRDEQLPLGRDNRGRKFEISDCTKVHRAAFRERVRRNLAREREELDEWHWADPRDFHRQPQRECACLGRYVKDNERMWRCGQCDGIRFPPDDDDGVSE